MGRAPQRLETQTLFFIQPGDARQIDFGADSDSGGGEIFSRRSRKINFKLEKKNVLHADFLFPPKVFNHKNHDFFS